MSRIHDPTSKPMSRRALLRAASATALLAACGGTKAGTTGAPADADPDTNPDASPPAGWASGGTAAMTAKPSYPDPFAGGGVGGCALVCATTDGPCTTEQSALRVDVSEAKPGLPVRLLLRLWDDGCAPLAGAEVWIWHTDNRGVYSGQTPDPPRCYGADPAAPEATYFRGRQLTDDAGRVAFDTCFPGFYPSRAVHIHVQVRLADATVHTAQVFFDDPLVTEIFAAHPDYSPFGQPKTKLDNDGVLAGETDRGPMLLQTQKMSDGAMLASKTLTVRSSLLAAEPRICGA